MCIFNVNLIGIKSNLISDCKLLEKTCDIKHSTATNSSCRLLIIQQTGAFLEAMTKSGNKPRSNIHAYRDGLMTQYQRFMSSRKAVFMWCLHRGSMFKGFSPFLCGVLEPTWNGHRNSFSLIKSVGIKCLLETSVLHSEPVWRKISLKYKLFQTHSLWIKRLTLIQLLLFSFSINVKNKLRVIDLWPKADFSLDDGMEVKAATSSCTNLHASNWHWELLRGVALALNSFCYWLLWKYSWKHKNMGWSLHSLKSL